MFKNARIKLTLWYLLISAAISFSFSAFVFVGVQENTKRVLESQKIRIERRYTDPSLMMDRPLQRPVGRMGLEPEDILEIRNRTLLLLIYINSIVLVLAGGLGYFLAGRTLKPIEHAIEKQKYFISNASHDFKTPLTIMKTDLEVTLRDNDLNLEKAKKSLSNTIDEINNLTLFLKSLLNKSQLQDMKTLDQDMLEEFDLKEIISDTVKSFKTQAQQKDISIKTELSSYTIKGDKQRLKQAIMNLLDNAVKFGEKGSDIIVDSFEENGNANIKVTNFGPEITKDQLSHIFEPFYKADSSRNNSSTQGVGLGLSIVDEIVRLHNGKIKVTSNSKQGTTFWVLIPKTQ